MSLLSELLSSKIRENIFSLLFAGSVEELHMREIQRRSGMSIGAVQQELQKLEKLDVIKSRRSSNRLYYHANKEHPLYIDIRNLVLKTSGLADVLKEALKDQRIKVAFVFGSIAENNERAGSDVDLMVIGELDLEAIVDMLHGVTDKIDREINPHVFSEAEFKKRLKAKEHFITSIMDVKKIFIVGTEDDLKAMGG